MRNLYRFFKAWISITARKSNWHKDSDNYDEELFGPREKGYVGTPFSPVNNWWD